MLRAFVILIFLLLSPTSAFAQDLQITPVQDYKRAEVVKVVEEGVKKIFDSDRIYQIVELKILEDDQKGEIITINHGERINLKDYQKVNTGDKVVIYRGGFNDQIDDFQIIDKYRLDHLWILVVVFFALVIFISRLKGLGSILGLSLSFLVILNFIVPQILSGKDPVLISITGASIIMLITIYLSHGFSFKTSIALFSTIITLIFTGIISFIFVKMTKLSGLGDEAAYGLTFGPTTSNINFEGLLLGGIIIGALGVLDDVTTTQTATVYELTKTDRGLNRLQIFQKGMNVGKEHISSLVNTLFLAYTGVSLPILLLLILNPSQVPLWLILNNEPIAQEVVRTVAGSMGLVLAVPITTFLASYFFSKRKIKVPNDS